MTKYSRKERDVSRGQALCIIQERVRTPRKTHVFNRRVLEILLWTRMYVTGVRLGDYVEEHLTSGGGVTQVSRELEDTNPFAIALSLSPTFFLSLFLLSFSFFLILFFFLSLSISIFSFFLSFSSLALCLSLSFSLSLFLSISLSMTC